MTRDYDPKSPIINPLLIKKINEARKNIDDNIFIEFLNVLYDSEFIIPVYETNITGSDVRLLDVTMLQNEDGIFIPIFTNYFEMRKLEGTTKKQKSLVTDIYDIADLLFSMAETGAQGIVIDPFGINLTLSMDFIEGAEVIMQSQKQTKLIKEMHDEILISGETN